MSLFKEDIVKKILTLALLVLALPIVASSAAKAPAAAPDALEPACKPAALVGVPSPHKVSTCTNICIADFKICRDSCHSLACYNQCRDAYDECVAGC